MLGNKTSDEWVDEYTKSHQHPINKLTHKIGIPLIALSLPLFLVAVFVKGFWILPLTMFLVGWILQFVGHYLKASPGVLRDWRFLLVGLRWWFKKIRG
jgi:uncharacterized membrane protein YGL010W